MLEQFAIISKDKWDRAINGVVGKGGMAEGGIGEGASDMAKLAAYDKLGGLIKKDGRHLKMGCFWNFAKHAPRKEPEIVYVFYQTATPGDPMKKVEIPEGQKIPLEVQAAEIARAEAKAVEKPKKKGRPKKEEIVEG